MRRAESLATIASKPYWREADARVIVEAWRSSGEALMQFSRRHGLDHNRVRRWVSRVDSGGPSPSPAEVTFHPVRVKVDPWQATERHVELMLPDGRGVRVPEGFDIEYLRRVLAVVEHRG